MNRAPTTTPVVAIRRAMWCAARLSGLEGGAGAVLTNTGMSAILLVTAGVP